MNLTALFNKNYLKQNIKKSKAILLLCVIAMPIINALILLLINNNIDHNYFMDTAFIINAVNFVGMYIIPEIIAICFFNYIFNKKSVDFIGSMPINRKSVYFTNLIGGMLIIVLIQLLIAVSTLALIPFLGSIFIVPSMVISTFFRYTLYYLFVYATAVLAVSLSNNIFVQVVITLLITFFVPFLYDSFNVIGIERAGDTAKTALVIDGDTIGLESLNDTVIATSPYYFIKMLFTEGKYSYLLSNILMLGLTIFYSIVAGYFFYNKKMEHAGEGITNEKAHVIVKAMTFLPFMTFYEVIFKDNIIGSAIFFTVLFVYSIIYDIITKRKISFKLQICSFIIIAVIYLGMFGGYVKYAENKETYNYHRSDIESINVVLTMRGTFNNNVEYDEMLSSNQLKYNITDDEIIEFFASLENESGNYYSIPEDEYDNGMSQASIVKFNFNDGKSGSDRIYLRGKTLAKAIELLSKDNGYYDALKKDLSIDNAFATEVVFDFVKADRDIKEFVLNNYNDSLPKSLKELYDYNLEQINADYDSNANVGSIYKYINNEIVSYRIIINRNDEASKKIVDYINNQTRKNLKQPLDDSDGYNYASILQLSRGAYSLSKDYDAAILWGKYQEIRNSQYGNYLVEELKNLILNNPEDVDLTKDYYELTLSINMNSKNYRLTYYTNKTAEVNQIIEKLFEEKIVSRGLRPKYDSNGKIVLDENNYIVFENYDDIQYEIY